MSFDPTIGRWISEDPIGFEAADANLYRYVGNNAKNATDPGGLEVLNWVNKYPGIPLQSPHPKAGVNDVIGEQADPAGNKIKLYSSKTSFYGKIVLNGNEANPIGFGKCIADFGVNIWLVERNGKGEFDTVVWVNIAPSSAANQTKVTDLLIEKLLAVRNAKKPNATTIAEDMKAVGEAFTAAEAAALLKPPTKTLAGDARFEVVYYTYTFSTKASATYRLYGTGKGVNAKSEWRRASELGLDGSKIAP